MSLSNKYKRVPVHQIVVLRDERQRKEITTNDLEHSIATRGVLQPIIVEEREGKIVLIAGERRLTTSIKLGLPDIPVRFANDLDENERQVIELEENVRRKDLPWRDYVSAIFKLHQINLVADPEWTQSRMAQFIGFDESHMSKVLRVGRDLDSPKIVNAPTFVVAFNILSRQDDRRISDALSDIVDVGVSLTSGIGEKEAFETADLEGIPAGGELEVEAAASPTVKEKALEIIKASGATPVASTPPTPESILNISFLEWAPTYSGQPFNFLHCDFPYGINVFDGAQSGRAAHTTYNDSPDVYWALMKCLCENLDKVMSPSGHLMFWFSMEYYSETLAFFEEHAPSLCFQKFPLIWTKSDNVGILPDPKRGPRRIYETALIASREDRLIVRAKSNSYSSPTDKAHHHSTKPEPMLRHFFEMFVDEYTRMLDPTCGSGSALRAAESLGAANVLGLELDPEHCASARTALRSFRTLRKVSK